MRMIKKIDAAIRDLVTELEAADKKISTLESEAEKFSDDIRKAISDFVKKDRLITKDSVEEQVPEFDKIKKHQCPSCGGSLRIDSDKQMYHCTFCGSTYDYEYFREERIHEAGETYLSRGEFMATTEAYEFMLKKDPHDFLALRGLMLAAAHLTDMSELDQVNESFSYDSQMVNRVIENASEDDKKYFTEFAKVYAAKKRLVDCSEEIEALREEKKKINSVIKEYNKGGEGKWPGDEFRTKGDMTIQYIIFWFLTAFFVMVALAFVYVIPILPFAIIFGITGLILVVLNNFIYFSSLRKMKELDKGNTELYGEFAKMEDKIRELENESSKLAGDIRRFVHEFVRKDRLKMRDYKSR